MPFCRRSWDRGERIGKNDLNMFYQLLTLKALSRAVFCTWVSSSEF